MRQLVIFLAILIFLCPSLSLAQVCPNPRPYAQFSDEIRPVEYIRTESAQDLTEWQTGHSIAPNKVLGVGGGSVGTKLKVRYEMREVGEDLFCVTPVEVAASFYAAPQIHVASNFARGSCEYSEVLAHEQKHITVLRKFHREYRGSYQSFFQKMLKDLPQGTPVPLAQVETEKKKTTAAIMAGMDAYSSEMMSELNERQRSVDTKEEYKRVIAKCDNWIQKLGQDRGH